MGGIHASFGDASRPNLDDLLLPFASMIEGSDSIVRPTRSSVWSYRAEIDSYVGPTRLSATGRIEGGFAFDPGGVLSSQEFSIRSIFSIAFEVHAPTAFILDATVTGTNSDTNMILRNNDFSFVRNINLSNGEFNELHVTGVLQPGRYELRSVARGSINLTANSPFEASYFGSYDVSLTFIPGPGACGMLIVSGALTRRSRKRWACATMLHSLLRALPFVSEAH